MKRDLTAGSAACDDASWASAISRPERRLAGGRALHACSGAVVEPTTSAAIGPANTLYSAISAVMSAAFGNVLGDDPVVDQ